MKLSFFLTLGIFFCFGSLVASANYIQDNASFLSYKASNTCIAGVCTLKDVKSYQEGGVQKQLFTIPQSIVEKNFWGEKVKTAITPTQITKKNISEGPGGFEFRGKKIGNYQVREFEGFSCGGGSYEQQLFDSKGKAVTDNKMKQTVKVGDISYASDYNFASNFRAIGFIKSWLTMLDKRVHKTNMTAQDFFTYQDSLFVSSVYDLYKSTFDFLKNQNKEYNDTFRSNFDNYKSNSLTFFKRPSTNKITNEKQLGYIPMSFYATDVNNIVHKFTINQEPLMRDSFSEFFAIHKLYLSDALQNNQIKDGNLVDFDITRKVIEQYISNDYFAVVLGSGANYGDANWIGSADKLAEYDTLKKIKSAMPLFKVLNFGDYSVYYPLQNKMQLQVTAEMCKPLVYIYDSNNTPNSLILKGIGLGFTKLIPSFNTTQGRDFTLKNNKPIVNNISFDYLYYSVKVPNYQFSSLAVYVPGSEMQSFFNTTLPAIGFNPKEQDDFTTYWNNRISKDAHYAVSIKYNTELDPYVQLNFKKPYKQTNRVLFEFRELAGADKAFDRNKYNNNQKLNLQTIGLIKPITRIGDNEVFERGGVYRDLGGKMSAY